MESAFGWLGQLIEWLGLFIPRRILIDTTEAGVKWVNSRKGSKVVPMQAGFHWYWPFTSDYKLHPIKRQTVDLRPQTIETKDGQTIIAGGLVVYEVTDIERVLVDTYNPDQTLKDVCLPAIHDVLSEMTWEEIKTAPRLHLRLKNEVQREVEPFGVKVLKTKLTDLARSPVLRIIQSTNQDGL